MSFSEFGVVSLMPESATDNLPLDVRANPVGWINPVCSYQDHEEQRFIQINGVHCYLYDLNDKLSEAWVWIHLHQCNYAKLSEIEKGTRLSGRSLRRWNAAVKKDGPEALLPKPKSGRPRTITDSIKQEALRLTREGKTHGQVTAQLGIGSTSLDKIIANDKAKRSRYPTEQFLDFGSDEPGSLTPDSGPNPTESSQSAPLTTLPGIGVDPLDRSSDRALARIGLLNDATPIHAPGERIYGLGFFMAIVLLDKNPLLEIFEEVYGKGLGPSFYGLRTTVMTLLMMLLLRITRPEHLRLHNPKNLGRALGLDRIMEVKTLRRKIHTLANQGKGIELMEKLGKSRLQAQAEIPRDGELTTLYLDGHVRCYKGSFKIGQTWSATSNRVVKGRTDTWLHIPGQTPLFYLESSFNEGLVSAIENHLSQIDGAFEEKPVLVFDREGWDVKFLNELDQNGWKFITYRKGNYPDLPLQQFDVVETGIGARTYAHRPVDIEKQSYNLYETTTGKGGVSSRRRIGEKSFREIRILSDDQSHQIAVVTNLTKADADATIVSATLFARWGNQENVFKYMIAEFGLDHLMEYNRSEGLGSDDRSAEEEIPDRVDHPNPVYTKLTRQISKKVTQQTKLLARYGIAIETISPSKASDEEIDPEVLAKTIKEIRASKDGKNLQDLNLEIINLRVERAKHPQREKASAGGYKQLRRGVSHITDSLKMVAYDLENQLYGMLEIHYPNRDKEGRKLIAAALRSNGSLRLDDGKIVIRLEAQSSPNRTAAIDGICRELNLRKAKFPGTNFGIEFDTCD